MKRRQKTTKDNKRRQTTAEGDKKRQKTVKFAVFWHLCCRLLSFVVFCRVLPSFVVFCCVLSSFFCRQMNRTLKFVSHGSFPSSGHPCSPTAPLDNRKFFLTCSMPIHLVRTSLQELDLTACESFLLRSSRGRPRSVQPNVVRSGELQIFRRLVSRQKYTTN